MDGSVEGDALAGLQVPGLKGGPFKGVLEAGADLTDPHILPDQPSSNARPRSPPLPLPWFTRKAEGGPGRCLNPCGQGVPSWSVWPH